MESLFLSTIYGKNKPTNPTDIENVVANPWSSRTSCLSLPCTSQPLKMSCNGGEGTQTTASASDQEGLPAGEGRGTPAVSHTVTSKRAALLTPTTHLVLPLVDLALRQALPTCILTTPLWGRYVLLFPLCVEGTLSQTAQGYRVSGRAGVRVCRVLCAQSTPLFHSKLCFWPHEILSASQIKGIWLLHIKWVEGREGNDIMGDSCPFICVCFPLPKNTIITHLLKWGQPPEQA